MGEISAAAPNSEIWTRRSPKEAATSTLISIGNLEMNSGGGEMSPLHESALFQPRSIRSGSTKSRTAMVFTCRKCGSTDMEEQEKETDSATDNRINSQNRGAIQ